MAQLDEGRRPNLGDDCRPKRSQHVASISAQRAFRPMSSEPPRGFSTRTAGAAPIHFRHPSVSSGAGGHALRHRSA